MLAYVVVHVRAAVFAGPDLVHALCLRVVRGRQVGRTSQQFRDGGREMIEHGAAGRARRHFLTARNKLGAGSRDRLLPVGRQLPLVAALELGAQFGRRLLDTVGPGHAGLTALGADLTPLAQQWLGDHERRRIPTEDLPRAGDFLFARRVAMGLLGTSLGREAKADDCLAGDHRRLVGYGTGGGDGVADRVGVVAVNLLDVPAGGAKALKLGIGYRKAGRAIDRDRIVVPEGDQVAELVVARHGDSFLADTLHQAAIAHKDVGPMLA